MRLSPKSRMSRARAGFTMIEMMIVPMLLAVVGGTVMSMLATLLDALSARLLWTSAQACLMIGGVALACRLLPRLPAAVRCMLWWLVGAQLVLGLAWHTPLQLRWPRHRSAGAPRGCSARWPSPCSFRPAPGPSRKRKKKRGCGAGICRSR